MKLKRKPEWMKLKVQGSKSAAGVRHLLDDLHLNTVCTHANCPNRMECYERGTATFMILGSICTRNCRFCDVTHGRPDAVNEEEPKNLAKAVERLKLKHAVITSVDRDDLEDGGATQFKNVIKEIRALTPEVTVEVLIPDLKGKKELMDIIFDERPDVLNHNIEVVPELYKDIMPGSKFERSLSVLEYAKEKGLVTKTGIMVGLGETEEQMVNTFKRLREVDCNMLTIGQYLQPSLEHAQLKEYVTPEQFKKYEDIAYELGFAKVASGPFVRSSYHAEAIKL
ncbi:lipoyl synthase [Miniphocaeibacter massiliensis]|uniref:lipoyl synthase n=1 Tax=Miniphocaeibacter massiliensis TaxID=2041841 RepID=UPI000C1BA6D3|nr:lipoyl synthase [Miniphocaeibacter massiliensis]